MFVERSFSLLELGLVMQTISCLDRGSRKYRTTQASFFPIFQKRAVEEDKKFPGMESGVHSMRM
jgi:hypothetical protein